MSILFEQISTRLELPAAPQAGFSLRCNKLRGQRPQAGSASCHQLPYNVQYAPRDLHFSLASGVHLGRHRIGGLNRKNSARCASDSLQLLTPTDPLAFSPKWTMTLNQNADCAQLAA